MATLHLRKDTVQLWIYVSKSCVYTFSDPLSAARRISSSLVGFQRFFYKLAHPKVNPSGIELFQERIGKGNLFPKFSISR